MLGKPGIGDAWSLQASHIFMLPPGPDMPEETVISRRLSPAKAKHNLHLDARLQCSPLPRGSASVLPRKTRSLPPGNAGE